MCKYNKLPRCRCSSTSDSNGALSQDGTFPVVTVLCFRPIVSIFFMLDVIVKLFEVIPRTCEKRVPDEMHEFVMLTIGSPKP